MKNEIEIPEGCEAKIVGKKVVFIPKESEDERIRREILETLNHGIAFEDSVLMPGATTTLKEAIIYLEKQKDEAQKQFNLGIQAGKEEVLYEMEKEQKPMEWSGEDEKNINWLIEQFDFLQPHKEGFYALKVRPWLVSLLTRFNPKPYWKPSKKQITSLEASYSVLKAHDTWDEDEHLPLLLSLYNDLKKL